MQASLISKLESYKPLDKQEDLTEFVSLVKQVVQLGNPQYISVLLSFFSDDSEFPDVMEFLLTELEDYPPEEYIPKLMESLPDMLTSSPQWLITIVVRMFNDKCCLEIFKKNITLSPRGSMIKLLDLVAQESEHHKTLCMDLKKELLERSK